MESTSFTIVRPIHVECCPVVHDVARLCEKLLIRFHQRFASVLTRVERGKVLRSFRIEHHPRIFVEQAELVTPFYVVHQQLEFVLAQRRPSELLCVSKRFLECRFSAVGDQPFPSINTVNRADAEFVRQFVDMLGF
jgi:hypothetical protein